MTGIQSKVLKVADNLTTDSFLSAFRRFVGRRGPLRQLRTDQD